VHEFAADGRVPALRIPATHLADGEAILAEESVHERRLAGARFTQQGDGPTGPGSRDDGVEALVSTDHQHRRLRRHSPDGRRHLVGGLPCPGVSLGEATLNTPYRNTIHVSEQPNYPGDIQLEQRIENIVRWNAMAMVLQAYDNGSGVGGHIATYASAATFMEVMLNHFVRSRTDDYQGDMFNIQAHASPGIYARACLEGRLTLEELANFRRELQPGGGLPSYPHPRRRPNLWPSPCASMGLSGVSAIYYARFAKYLENRGLTNKKVGKIWAILGDGEMDEPESLGTINIASREGLDNLIFVINCNLQRLDGRLEATVKSSKNLKQFLGARNGMY